MIHDDAPDCRVSHFATVTASLSHELGNALASALETAGLIADWVVATEEGRPLDPARVEGAVGRIERSVNRGLESVHLLNWIAHGVDAAQAQPMLGAVVDRAAASARYFARQRNVTLEVAGDTGNVAVRGAAFDLHLLLFSCIRLAIDDAADGACITVHSGNLEEGGRVLFRVSELRQGGPEGSEARDRVASLGAKSGCRLSGSSPPRAEEYLVLHMPGISP